MPSVQFRSEGDSLRAFQLGVVKPNTYDANGKPVAFDKWGTASHDPAQGTMVIDFLCDDPVDEQEMHDLLQRLKETRGIARKQRLDARSGELVKYIDDEVKASGPRIAVKWESVPDNKKRSLRDTGRATVRIGPSRSIKSIVGVKKFFIDRRSGSELG